MIVARIDGGLGNQLFQVAFGLQLARRHSTELVLDLSSYGQQPIHGYLLHHYALEARKLRADEVGYLPSRYRNPGQPPTLVQRLGVADWLSGKGLRRVRERQLGFDPRFLQSGDNSYLVGYWQSELYFPDVHAELRSRVHPMGTLSRETQRLRKQMERVASVAVHVRRGDYVSSPQAASIYRNLSLDYYRECVGRRLAERNGVEVFVFSNDIAWCQQNLALPCPVHYVQHTTPSTAHEDLYLMSAAECHVIANSTFSWWGAWLSQRPNQRVYSPASWFYPGTLDDQYLACQSWCRVADPSAIRAAA